MQTKDSESSLLTSDGVNRSDAESSTLNDDVGEEATLEKFAEDREEACLFLARRDA